MHGNPTELLLLAWPPIEAAPELRPLWQAQQTLHFKFRPAAAADVIGDGVAAAAAAASFCCFFKTSVKERVMNFFSSSKKTAMALITYSEKNKSFL